MKRLIRLVLLLAALGAGCGASHADDLLWFDAGRPKPDAQTAVNLLAQADQDGLNPDDYGAAQWQQALANARRDAPLSPQQQASLDAALSAAVLQFLSERQNGRIDPRQIHARFGPVPPRPAPTLSALASAVAGHRLAQAVQQYQPSLPLYESLRRARAQYQALAGHAAWRDPLPALPGRKVDAQQAYAGLPLVAQRLQALGDLAPDAPLPAVLAEPLSSALRRFQTRHGLLADGILGPATWQQLNVTPALRVRQIELALERLRWTPYLESPRMIVVNIPEFVLRAYEVENGQIQVRLSMKVIVGKALDTRTPLIQEQMRFIEFNPYWNVPPSITRKELVPRLRRDPAYFAQQGFEFVGPGGEVVNALSGPLLDAALSGRWRIRQRPGPLNALGDIKFIFPNNENIYLHHTPAPQLFERQRRDFSHGCIRVEEPLALAGFVLRDQSDWDAARIEAAMSRGVSSTLALRAPLPVLITYSTVIVKGGQVFFFPDLYGHDRLLDQALRQRADKPTGFVPLPARAQ